MQDSRFSRFISIDEKSMTGQIKNYLDTPEESVVIPFEYEVCPTCKGCGSLIKSTYENNNSYLSLEELDKPNSNCFTCEGFRVTPTIAEEKAKPIQLRSWISLLENESFEDDWLDTF